MTPQEARELLDKATPGPWDCVGQDDEYPRVARDGYQDITNDATNFNAPLIAAAPALAELVANLHYEYAVELKHGDGWITSRHHAPTIETAKEIAARYTRTETRIVRRLATDPEVVE